MDFRLLTGPIEVSTEAGEPIELGGRRQRSVLGILLMNANRVVTTDRFIDDLWGGVASRSLRTSLQRFVSDVRRALGPYARRLQTVPGGYVFDAAWGEIDVRRFEHLAERGRELLPVDPEKAALVLGQALAMWGRASFEDLADIPSVSAELVRLDEVRAAAGEDRVEADLARGRHRDLVGDLEQMVDALPFREVRWRQLMIALYRAGRQVEALRAYQRLRRLLETELGVEPSTEIQDLEQMMLRHDPALRWAPAGGSRRDNLPAHLGPFVGRESLLAELEDRFEKTRLVTLCGPGGIGKSRLALEAATALLDRYGDGGWWVDMATLRESTRVPNEVAAAVGIPEPSGADITAEVIGQLDGKELLLVLDGCEHVIDPVARFVQALVSSDPHVSVLVTSREQLRVPGETVVRVPPLATVPADGEETLAGVMSSESGRLFAELAAFTNPSFELTDVNAPAVADICRCLDGIPLAIELAVARTASMTVHDIADRLRDKVPLLTDGARTAVPHHRTLEAVLDWSHRLLSGSEQVLFRRLSVFAGGFTLEAAEQICSDGGLPAHQIVGELGRLVDKSLVLPVLEAHRSRFRLLGTVRDYAARKLTADGEFDRFDRACRLWYLGLADAAFQRLPSSFAWHQRLHDEFENLRAAYDGFAGDGDTEARLRLASALYWFCAVSGHVREGAEWVDAALAAAGNGEVPARTLAIGLAASGSLAATRGDYEQARRQLEESLRCFEGIGHARGMAWCHLLMARAALTHGSYDEAAGSSERAIGLARGADDPLHTAYALMLRAAVPAWRSVQSSEMLSDEDYEAAIPLFQEASGLAEHLGFDAVQTAIRLVHGVAVGVGRDPVRGLAMCEEAIERSGRHGDWAVVADAHACAGILAIRADWPGRAGGFFVDALATSLEVRYTGTLRSALEGLAGVRALLSDYETAAVLFGAAEARPRGGVMTLPLDSRGYRDLAQRNLGAAAYRHATQEGASLPLRDVVSRASVATGHEPRPL